MNNDKREHIMEVAVELFATNGFEGTSIRQLAQRADVNIAMIHYYFGSKEKLFETMLEHKASYMRNRIEAVISDRNRETGPNHRRLCCPFFVTARIPSCVATGTVGFSKRSSSPKCD
jgi:AcrR family transcriptional regulator